MASDKYGFKKIEKTRPGFSELEKKWQKKWAEKKVFLAREGKKKKFYLLEMYPYPSGSGLHMGHAFNYTVGDLFARMKRMQGFNVLYPMGYDSFGLPAENAAIKNKVHPKIYTEKAVANFIKQQKELGLSYDWSRILMTHKPEYYKWNQFFFLKFFEKGLVYRKKAPVNWCPKCNSVLANEQVHNGRCWVHKDTGIEVKLLEQWFIKTTKYSEELLKDADRLYWPERIKVMQKNWIGKSIGTEILFDIEGEKWPVFTTRPDTLFGVTFMVVSAQHPRLFELVKEKQKKEVEKFLKKIKSVSGKELEELGKEGVFTGSYAVNPINKEKMPVYAGNFVLADYGSGMVMAVPCHDQRDFEFAKKYKLPIIQVIRKKDVPIKSYLMGAFKITDNDLTRLGIKIIEKTKSGSRKIEIPKDNLKEYEKLIVNKLDNGFWNEYIGEEIVFLFKHKDGKVERIVLDRKTEERIDKLAAEFNGEKWNKSNVWKWLAENDFYTDLIVHDENGILINSKEFNGLFSDEAAEHITKALEFKKLGRKAINYKFRDWLVSRQRYWGTPIPIIYCEKCGMVPVPEKDLPVVLPEKVKFGKGNPLETNENFINVKCPKCGNKGRRETDTMDTFFDSSWYYLRYCDSKNSKKPFDPNKIKYWMPVDQYIGGSEHATMHLIYARFFIKALRDLGFLKFDEPFLRLFNQGMLHGSDGFVMSKSRGNVVLPEEISEKYGIDTARLFLVSIASTDKDIIWNDSGIEGSLRFIYKIIDYFENIKYEKINARTESKLNKTIKLVTEDIENFQYNLAIIRLRELFNHMEKGTDKKTAETFLKLLHPFCPHITEELWQRLGNKNFLSLEKWPIANEKKINEDFEKEEKAVESLINDINNVVNIVRGKGREVTKLSVYVIPNEKGIYLGNIDSIRKRTNLDVSVYAINDKNKRDPGNKSKNVKPGRPGIYLE
ncbi:MAG: leucine--tRNA ligase [Nanoarchaeota archaeon]